MGRRAFKDGKVKDGPMKVGTGGGRWDGDRRYSMHCDNIQAARGKFCTVLTLMALSRLAGSAALRRP